MQKHRWGAGHWMLLVLGLVIAAVGADHAREVLKPPPPVPLAPDEPEWQRSKKAPDFELPDAKGVRQRLSDLVRTRPRTVLMFAGDDTHSRRLQRYLATLAGLMGAHAPLFVTVATFDPAKEPAFRRASGLRQVILYEPEGGPVARQYKAEPRPRIVHLEPGLTATRVGRSPQQDSIYHIGVAAAAALGFESPHVKESRRPGPDPVFLDQRQPAYPVAGGQASATSAKP